MKGNVLVISVSNKSKGGVASVVNAFMGNEILNKTFKMTYFHSHTSGSTFKKVITFLYAAFIFPFLLLSKKFDVAHIHGSLKGSFARKSYFLFWLRIFSIPSIYQCHAAQVDDFFNRLNKKQYEKVVKTFGKYDLCLCLGNSWVDKFEVLTKRNWKVLFNPVPELNLVRTPHATCNFTFMGELSLRKGVIDLLYAIAKTKSDNIHLFVAGSGDLASLKDLTKKLEITDRVEFLGWVNKEKKLELLAKTDVVVLPSYAEGLPMSILEAMSLGLPVITTPVGAVEDAVTHNVHGLLVEPGNIDQLTNALTELASNDTKRSILGVAAKTKFNECFRDDQVVALLSAYYIELINKGKS